MMLFSPDLSMVFLVHMKKRYSFVLYSDQSSMLFWSYQNCVINLILSYVQLRFIIALDTDFTWFVLHMSSHILYFSII